MDKKDYLQIIEQNFPEYISDPLVNIYVDKHVEHVKLVNEYAKKIGKSFPEHDLSKISLLLPGYIWSLLDEKERTPEQNKQLRFVTILHNTQSSHHPENWGNLNIMEIIHSKTPFNQISVNCENMDQISICEMLCDWCANGYNTEETLLNWLHENNIGRWIFTKEQEEFIVKTIDMLV